ncbi:MAG: pantoate--beta-alanine ligase [Saprospiraceae bacterium]
MLLISTVAELQKIILEQKKAGKTIGFVPTMGALHRGHLSLLEAAKDQSDYTICSIFVNPTQFNDPKDLTKYPRTPEADQAALEAGGCDLLFMPTAKEVYPDSKSEKLKLDLGHLDQVLEGAFRPGHFAGVVQVVDRLLDITMADLLFMGQKDYQQFAIIRTLIESQNKAVELVMGPTVRENDGLAMSSRNVRLTPANREKAPIIYQLLQQAKADLGREPIASIEQQQQKTLEKMGFRPEYFSIVDAKTLLPINQLKSDQSVVACVAVWAGDVRLIDNLILQ